MVIEVAKMTPINLKVLLALTLMAICVAFTSGLEVSLL